VTQSLRREGKGDGGSKMGTQGHMHPRRKTNKRSDKGFTLIEVVVAVAILGIALTVVIELFAGGLRLARTSKEYTKAVSYAHTKMEDIGSQQNIEEGVSEGEFDDVYHWRVEMKKVNILPVERPWEVKPPVELFQVRVDVLWRSGSKEKCTRIESYRTIKIQDNEKKS
jgi:general secretion pathway protein I